MTDLVLPPRGVMLPLSLEFSAFNHGTLRNLAHLRLLLIHTTEGASARSTAAWFATKIPLAQGGPASAHVVVDDLEGYRVLPDSVVAYGAGNRMSAQTSPVPNDTNDVALHLEISGHHDWPRETWLQHDATLQRGGAVLAAWADGYSLPLVMLGPEAVRDHLAQGVATHKTISDAYGVKGGHQDPGEGFPLDVLLGYARGG